MRPLRMPVVPGHSGDVGHAEQRKYDPSAVLTTKYEGHDQDREHVEALHACFSQTDDECSQHDQAPLGNIKRNR